MAHSTLPITKQAETDRSTELSLVVSLRPAQWTKNLFVFGALLFGQRDGRPAFLAPKAIAHPTGAFFIFCSLAGVIYLITGVADRESDRLHPLKKHRPIA